MYMCVYIYMYVSWTLHVLLASPTFRPPPPEELGLRRETWQAVSHLSVLCPPRAVPTTKKIDIDTYVCMYIYIYTCVYMYIDR